MMRPRCEKTLLLSSLIATTALGCSSTNGGDPETSQLDINLTMGSNSEHIVDVDPQTQYVGDELHVTTQVTTSSGNRLVIIFARSSVQDVTAYEVGLGKAVQAGFTVPGSSGTVFFEAGTFTLTAANWSGGRVEGTFAGLHRPADALGVAPEASGTGSVSVVVPAR